MKTRDEDKTENEKHHDIIHRKIDKSKLEAIEESFRKTKIWIGGLAITFLIAIIGLFFKN